MTSARPGQGRGPRSSHDSLLVSSQVFVRDGTGRQAASGTLGQRATSQLDEACLEFANTAGVEWAAREQRADLFAFPLVFWSNEEPSLPDHVCLQSAAWSVEWAHQRTTRTSRRELGRSANGRQYCVALLGDRG